MPKIDNTTLRNLLARKKEPVGFESTCVSKVDFEPTIEGGLAGDLTITFVGPPHGGSGSWRYYDVPLNVYVDFSQASSQGTYFNLYIRNQYSSEKVA